MDLRNGHRKVSVWVNAASSRKVLKTLTVDRKSILTKIMRIHVHE